MSDYGNDFGCDCGNFGCDVVFGDDYGSEGSDFGLFGIKIKFPKIKVSPPTFVKDALKAAGKGVGTITQGAAAVGDLTAKIPVVGTPISAVYSLSVGAPFKVVDSVVKGKRIDKVAYESLQTAVKNAQTLAPYAQSVVSLVPGVGTGISGVIGAANALSKGKPISQAVVEGVRGALPGGPAATAAFDVAYAGMQGKPITEVVLAAIPVPNEHKKLIATGMKAARDIANGRNVSETLVQRALDVAPPDVRQAMQVGMAIAQGQRLQQIAAKAIPDTFNKLEIEGSALVNKNDVLKAGFKTLGGPAQKKGFVIGTGLMSHKLTPTTFEYARKALSPSEKNGFDIAVATRVGQTTTVVPQGTAQQKFGYLVTEGAKDASPETKARIVKTVAKNPQIKVGVKAAIKKEKNPSIWKQIKTWLGIK